MRIFIRVQEPLLHFNDLRGASVLLLRKKNTEIVIIAKNVISNFVLVFSFAIDYQSPPR